MEGLPVTIRLLDPPLHEFLPHTEEDLDGGGRGDRPRRRQADAARPRAARDQPDARPPRLPARHLLSRDLRDAGARHHRGGAGGRGRRQDARPCPEIMHPLVAKGEEMDFLRQLTDRVVKAGAGGAAAARLDYTVGTMIELPRAAVCAGEIAAERRLLLVRHQRPDPDHLRHQPRRLRPLPGRLHRQGHLREGPVRLARPGGRRRAGADGRRARPRGARRHQARHLRRARRRSGLDRLLRRRRPRLRQLLALPRPHRPPRRGAGGAEARRPATPESAGPPSIRALEFGQTARSCPGE